MGKNKFKSETLEVTETSTKRPSTPDPETSKPAPQFNGPTITLNNIDVKSGGVITVKCLDDKVPLGRIQIIQVQAGDTTYTYRRV